MGQIKVTNPVIYDPESYVLQGCPSGGGNVEPITIPEATSSQSGLITAEQVRAIPGTNEMAFLAAIYALNGTGLLKLTERVPSLDMSSYLTGNETITLTGDVSGSGTTSIAIALGSSGVTAGSYGGVAQTVSLTVDAKGRITSAAVNDIAIAQSQVSGLIASLNSKADLVDGKIPSNQLPSYVDDVVEVENYAALPTTGETGKIYVTLDDNRTYRWSGSAYVEISASLVLGETSSAAYRGDRGKVAYDHSQENIIDNDPHGAKTALAAEASARSSADVTLTNNLNATTSKIILGTCATAQATVAKEVTLANYTLQVGDIVAVSMTNASCASATLNVNSTGAAVIYMDGAAVTDAAWTAGDIVYFLWDGSEWSIVSVKTPGGVSSVMHGIWNGSVIHEDYLRAPVNGARFQGVTHIRSDGVVQVGRYLDFHDTNASTSYGARIEGYNGTITFLGNFRIGGHIYPSAPDTYYCGLSSYAWAGGWTHTSFTETSTREAKTNIRDFTNTEKDVAKSIVIKCPQVYQLLTSISEKGKDSARLHSGCIYEDVYQCFVDGGLDPERYSIFCASKRLRTVTKTRTRTVITVIDGKAVQEIETESYAEPVIHVFPVVDSDGNAVMIDVKDADGNVAGTTQLTHEAPVYETDDDGNTIYDKGLRYRELQIWFDVGNRIIAKEQATTIAKQAKTIAAQDETISKQSEIIANILKRIAALEEATNPSSQL